MYFNILIIYANRIEIIDVIDLSLKNRRKGILCSVMNLIKIVITNNNGVDVVRHKIQCLWDRNNELSSKLSVATKIFPQS